jgi:acetate kinase
MPTSHSTSPAPGAGGLWLTLNAGSSSLKAAVFAVGAGEDGALERKFTAKVQRIGSPTGGARLETKEEGTGQKASRALKAVDHRGAGRELFAWLKQTTGPKGISAVGHRIVHGGPKHTAPTRVTAGLLKELRKLKSIDPDHLPAEIELAEAALKEFPGVPQVACFDTAFHRDLPRVAKVLAIPRRYEALGIWRYGFHGLSYAYLMEELQRVAGKAARGRVVLAHLGSGASLAAVKDGKSVDTTMGFTPVAGIPMGTRSGDLDPGLVGYLAKRERLSPAAFNEMVNRESGLKGISETSGDIRDLLERAGRDGRAAEAVEIFCYQTRKAIGALAAALGGLDTLVFAGGIGENSAEVRRKICRELGFLGIEIAAKANARNAAVISGRSGRVTVRVIPTDEERMMAREMRRILEQRTKEK